MQGEGGGVWPYSVGGAVLAFGALSLAQWGEYEGADAVVVLGLPTVLVGALVGAWIGGLLGDRSG